MNKLLPVTLAPGMLLKIGFYEIAEGDSPALEALLTVMEGGTLNPRAILGSEFMRDKGPIVSVETGEPLNLDADKWYGFLEGTHNFVGPYLTAKDATNALILNIFGYDITPQPVEEAKPLMSEASFIDMLPTLVSEFMAAFGPKESSPSDTLTKVAKALTAQGVPAEDAEAVAEQLIETFGEDTLQQINSVRVIKI